MPVIPIAASLIQLGIKYGPGLIRTLGKKKGGKAESVANTIADLTENLNPSTPVAEREEILSKAISALPPEQMLEAIALNTDAEAEIRKEEELTKRKQEETHQIRLQDNDLRTKRTRPDIARQSWAAAVAYVVLTLFFQPVVDVIVLVLGEPGASTQDLGLSFSIEVFLVLASPAFTFVGVRGLERWKAGGTPN